MQRAPNQTVFAVGEYRLVHSLREQLIGFLEPCSVVRHQDLFGVSRHFLHYAGRELLIEVSLI